MIVALGLPLNMAAIILGYILSMLLSVFNVQGPVRIPIPPTGALIEFFQADTVASVHPLPVLWYLISSVCMYLCSCMHIMSILCSTANAVSSGHHHHVALVARISLTLSRHSSLSFIALGRSSGQHPVSSHSCWMYVHAGRPAFARPCVGVHMSTSALVVDLFYLRF